MQSPVKKVIDVDFSEVEIRCMSCSFLGRGPFDADKLHRLNRKALFAALYADYSRLLREIDELDAGPVLAYIRFGSAPE